MSVLAIAVDGQSVVTAGKRDGTLLCLQWRFTLCFYHDDAFCFFLGLEAIVFVMYATGNWLELRKIKIEKKKKMEAK